MAQPYVRGAVHLWAGLTSGTAYLGTGERAPRVSIRKRFRDVQNDLGGDEPFDFAYMGRGGVVIVKLTRWNEKTLLALEGVTGGLSAGNDLGGVDIPGDIGTLMVTEGLAVPLWVQYSYSASGVAPQSINQNSTNGALRSGWHFLAAWLEGPDDHEGGTDPAIEALVFRCARVYDPVTGNFNLFNRDMSGLPAIN